MTLNEIRPGQRCVVTGVTLKSALRKRVIDMGITTGTTIYVQKLAPLGDPMEITVRGYELSLRKEEARGIEVRKIV
ncbi:MAG: FeoA family protein [Christensenellales bacterium]|jgi:ferrous iron transport protein A